MWTIERYSGTQLGYCTADGKPGKGRACKGWIAIHPEHLPNGKVFDTRAEAIAYIRDNWGEVAK